MKFIRDSLHGNLQINELEVKLIDTPQIQRLRRIKQLGFTYLVYPGANHTRFEHSIGAMYLASRLGNNLQLDEDKKELIRVCALLHDAGHGPFSHVSEGVVDTSHEELTSKLIKESQLSDILSENFNLNDVIKTINGEGLFGQVISGELDVDRMDYLLRDSYYTGVAYGVIDVERLIYNMELEGTLTLRRKGVQAAESMLLARYFMYPSVYQHHTTRIINSMFRKCLKELFETGTVDPENIYQYDDLDIITAARSQEGYIKDMISKLDNRELFKTVFSMKLDEIENPDAVFKLRSEDIITAERELSEDLGIPQGYIIVDVPEYPSFDEMKTQVSTNGARVKLGEISTIVSALKDARFNHADLCIYVPQEYSSKVSEFSFEDYIKIPD
ncbi:HD domain-containing protein [Methanobacterium aggregans]|uniref:HD domain-containing protein n=1 Tax=Methanobacterium aggregans TaxID=1615586 RepID=UPI001AE3984C|nr:HD domain-containing protein [Methanobacterium aggregans]MBP2045074.1 HD superfamily phosphohydrolase [Methanobacterium aggregans]